MDKNCEKWIVFLAFIALGFAAGKAFACSAYLDYEYTDGMYRICVYNHLGSRVPVAYSISTTCPLSIQVPHG
jgi:hypothetical protein